MTSHSITISGDMTAVQPLFDEALSLIEAIPRGVQPIDGFDEGLKTLVKVRTERRAAGTGNVCVILEPTDRFDDFLVALRARHAELSVVDNAGHGISPSLESPNSSVARNGEGVTTLSPARVGGVA